MSFDAFGRAVRPREPPRISAWTLYFQKLASVATFLSLIVWVYLHSNLCSRLQNTDLFCSRVRIGRSRSSKVDDFGTNRKRVCGFLLVRHCDYGPILHRFWDTATYWLKMAYFSNPTLIQRPRSLCSNFPSEFRGEVNHEETRVMGLSSSEDLMILAGVVLTWYRTVTGRRTELP